MKLGTRVWEPWTFVFVSLGSVLVCFLLLPLLGLVLGTSPTRFLAGIASGLVLPALRLSLLTTGISLVLVVALGAPLAWSLVRSRSRWASTIETLALLPMVIPPAVAGVAMLLAFGRQGLIARYLAPESGSIAFTTSAVVLAQVFVSAPFFLQAAIAAFRQIDPNLILVAQSLGARPGRLFFRIAIPLSAHGLVAGAMMGWARALGEFGATLMFAGNLPGTTQTLPLAMVIALESDLDAAKALAILLTAVAFVVLLAVRLMRTNTTRDEEDARCSN